MTRKGRWIFIIAMIAIISVAILVPTLAIWSDGSNVGGTAEVTLLDDITWRYLVLDGITSQGKHYYMTYNDAGYYEYNASYNIYDEEVDTSATSLADVAVIGYVGPLGEYESLVIPDSIPWKDSLGNAQANMHENDITIINMQSSAAFPSLKLIKSVVVPNTIEVMQGISFSFMPQLEAVYFNFESMGAFMSSVDTSDGIFIEGTKNAKVYFFNSATSEYYEYTGG